MKLKPRLRHFWRNNKKCIGMYFTFLFIAIAILFLCIGGYNDALNNLVLGLTCSAVWMLERHNDVRERILNVYNTKFCIYVDYFCDIAEQKARTITIWSACEYLRNHIDKDLTIYHNDTWLKRDEFIEKFKNEITNKTYEKYI